MQTFITCEIRCFFFFVHQQSLQDLTNFAMRSLIQKAQKKETVERMETDGFSVANSKFGLVELISFKKKD